MKINFKKISAIAVSALLTGMTMGFAAAVNFPSPYSSSTSSGVAVVTGTGTGVDDTVAATSISNYLAAVVRATGEGVSGGDSYLLEKTSTKFNLGDYAGDVVSTRITDDDDELPNLLADGEYIDNDNDEFDYTQRIDISNVSFRVTMFEDNDYKADEPTVGIRIANNRNVLNYTLDFTDDPLWADLATSDLPFMGKSYYVLSNGTIGDELTLLDSATSTILSEGETTTLSVGGKSYEVSINFISSTETKLTVGIGSDADTTNSLEEAQTYKLSDGAYLGIKDIMYSAKTGAVSKVEFSIGLGKLKLTNATDIELNEDTISDLSVIFTVSTTELQSIKVIWDAEEDLFITEDSTITMPGFEAVKVSFGGLTYPSEEEIKVEHDGDDSITLKNFPLKTSTESINILYYNESQYTLVGKDSTSILGTSGNSTLTFNENNDDWFVVSWNDTQDHESYLMKVTSFKNSSSKQMATFQYRKDGIWTEKKKDADDTDTVTLGNAGFEIDSLDKDTKVAVITATGGTVFNVLYSDDGMRVDLPWLNETALNVAVNDSNTCTNTNVTAAIGSLAIGQLGYSHNITDSDGEAVANFVCTYYPATYTLNFTEEDKNENLGTGNKITVTLGEDANHEVKVTGVDMGTYEGAFTEQLETDTYRNFAYSQLATEAWWDKSGDQYTLTLTYHDDEVTASVRVSAPETTIGAAAEAGSMVFTDAETTSWQSRDVILVGGSCINSATATALGVAYPTCESAFTAATGIGSGQYLIQSIAGSTGGVVNSEKIALVVAGYEKADTAAAAQRLANLPSTIDTTVGSKYLGIVGVEGTSTISKIA